MFIRIIGPLAIASAAYAQTVVTLATSANPVVFGQALTMTATVSPATSSGKVTFYDGVTVLGTSSLAAGRASLTTSLLATGTRSLTAYYAGTTSPVVVESVMSVAETGFAPLSTLAAGANGPLAIADFNGDGNADVAVAYLSGIEVLLGTGNGTFGTPVTSLTPIVASLVAGDFNGDGKTDLAFTSTAGAGILLGNGDGTFQAPTYYTGAGSIVAADFNGDGKLDLASADSSSQRLTILLGNGDGTFQALASQTPGVSPTGIAVGDFNNDGKADLAITSISTGTVEVLIGKGDGTFQTPGTSYNTAFEPLRIVTADINGDGKTDLVIGAFSGNVSLLLGNGDGTFQMANNYPIGQPGNSSFPVAVGDVNGDGKPDVVLSSFIPPSGPSFISVLYGNGDGTLQPVSNYAVPGVPSFMGVADFNHDGRTDLAFTYNSGLGILLGELRPLTSTSLAASVNPSQQGQTVTLTASVSPAAATGTVAFYDGTTSLGGNPLVNGQSSLTLTSLASSTHSLTAAYSGDMQFVTSTSPVLTQVVSGVLASPTVTLTSSANPARYGQQLSLSAKLSPSSATGKVTFLDGTAMLEVQPVVNGQASISTSLLTPGTHSIAAYYGGDVANAPGRAVLAETISAVPAFQFTPAAASVSTGLQFLYSIVAADFNGDGKADFAVVNSVASSTLRIFLGKGDGTFQAAGAYAAGSFAQSVMVGDVNGDGKADLILADGYLFLGNGDGTFAAPVGLPAGGTIAVADINNDGKADLVTFNAVLLGNGDGTFQLPINFSAPGDAMAVGDLNGDGKLDVVAGNSLGGNVTVLLGNGDGTMRTGATYPTGRGSNSIAFADFNGDGKMDFAVGNGVDNTVSILLGNGDGTFRPAVNYPAPSSPIYVVAADLNGDGKIDLAVADFFGGVSEFIGNGDGTFQAAASFAAGTNAKSLALADFNGDGRPDLAVANYGSQDVSILLGGNTMHLQFTSSLPAVVLAGVTLPPVVVEILDQNFNIIAGSTVPVTLTSSPAGINATVTAVNGVATFNGLVVNTPGSFTLTASAPGIVSASTALNVSSSLPTVVIDSPAAGATVPAGPTVISGWALDSINQIGTAISSVQVLLDGTPVGTATYGIPRLDVCGKYPQRPGCPNVGYNFTLNLGPGTHMITVVATDSDAVPDAASVSVTVTAQGLMTGTKAGVFRNKSAFLEDTPGEAMYDAKSDRYIPSFTGPGGFVAGDVPVAGDWTGDGRAKVGIYRASTGTWYLDANNDGVLNAGDLTYSFGGLTGDVPVVGDWLSKGKSCIGIYRSNGSVWLLDLNCNGSFDSTPLDAFFPFGGVPGDVPVVGAWTGNGTRVGVVRKYAPGGVPQGNPVFWVLDAGAANAGNLPANHPPAANPFAFGGLNGDVYVTGDWYNTGVWTAGVYRNGLWVLDAALPGSPQANHIVGLAFGFGGVPGDVPIPAKW